MDFPKGSQAMQAEEWGRTGRTAIWESRENLFHAGNREELSDYFEATPVKIAPNEHDVAFPGASFTNEYFLRAGNVQVLANAWREIFHRVESTYNFTKSHDWCKQEPAFEEAFRKFFMDQGWHGSLGWVSLITAQRPKPLRSLEDSRLKISRGHRRVVKSGLPFHNNCEAPYQAIGLSGVYLTHRNFLFDTVGPIGQQKLRRVWHIRRLKAEHWLHRPMNLTEWRLFPAADEIHDDIIKLGLTPSLNAIYGKADRALNATGYLNFCRVVSDGLGGLDMVDITIEINPASGRIITLRGFRLPFSGGILGASVVEHEALCTTLTDLII
jgi:hypothetical protein